LARRLIMVGRDCIMELYKKFDDSRSIGG